MFRSAARFVFPLAVTAAAFFGGRSQAQNAPENPYAVPMRDTTRTSYAATLFYAMGPQMGPQPEKRAPIVEKRCLAIRSTALASAHYTTSFGIGDGATPFDSARVAHSLSQLGTVDTHCYNVVLDFQSASVTRSAQDTTWIEKQIYHNDTSRPLDSPALFGAMGKTLAEIAQEEHDEIHVLVAIPGAMNAVNDFGKLPPGTRLLVMSDTKSPLYNPALRLMATLNPHGLNHTNVQRTPSAFLRRLNSSLAPRALDRGEIIDPFYFLETAIAVSDKENKLLAVFVTDQKAETITVDGKTVYGGGNEVIVVDLEEMAGKLLTEHKKSFTGAGAGYITGAQSLAAEKLFKKLARKNWPLDSLDALTGPQEHLFHDAFSVHPLQAMKAMALEFVSSDDPKTEKPRYLLDGAGMTGAEYFRRHCMGYTAPPGLSRHAPR